jgi:hypothetical protein
MDTEVRANSAVTDGGGIWTSGVLNIVGNAVHSNTAQNGGSVFNNGGSATITNAGVTTNTANSNGGGIWNAGALTINSGSYNANQAQNGGGIFNDGTLNVNGAQVNNNSAGQSGGGIHHRNGTAVIFNFSQINGNVISNTSTLPAQGGGVWNNATLVITNSSVNSNTVTGSGFSAGGGVYNNFNIYITNSSVNGNTAAESGFATAAGGGVLNNGALIIEDSQVNDNTASGGFAQGGGVQNFGAAEMRRGTIAGNVVSATNDAQGGGAFNAASGVLTVTFSTLAQNQAQGGNAGQGGGAFSSGTTRIEGSTVQTNTASSDGGGLYNNASVLGGGMIVQHSAVVSNTAQRGGAYNLAGVLFMRNSTVSGNTGDGLYADGSSSTQLQFVTVASNTLTGLNVATGANATTFATLLAYNSGGDCAGFAFPLFSLSSGASCLGMMVADPLLKPLALNGGGTLNHALSLGSPAIDKVPSAFCTTLSTTDQRLFSRPGPVTTSCDIGAFELQPYYPVFVPIVFRP